MKGEEELGRQKGVRDKGGCFRQGESTCQDLEM